MNDAFEIAHLKGTEGHPLLVAELGAKYTTLERMEELLRICAQSGVQMVKFQTYRAERIARADAWFDFEDGRREPQRDFFRRYELSPEEHRQLFSVARDLGLEPFSTPSDVADAEMLLNLGVRVFKTGADDLTNLPFLAWLACQGLPMMVSTGMSRLSEVEEAVRTIREHGNPPLVLMHSTTAYPPPPEDACLNVIPLLREAFGTWVGYSDHVPGNLASILSVVQGAVVVEKHLCHDRSERTGDWMVSMEPSELSAWVEGVRSVPVLLGSTVKTIAQPEEKWRRNARKSLVAARNLPAGHILGRDDLRAMRPSSGISPALLDQLMGWRLTRSVQEQEPLSWEDVVSRDQIRADAMRGESGNGCLPQ